MNLTLNSKQAGLTIIEILVALAISMIVMAGVTQIFMANRASARMQDSLSFVQDNGRFAMEILSRDMRMAGHMGCSDIDKLLVNVIGPAVALDVGYSHDSGTGDITIGYAEPIPGVTMTADMANNTSVIAISDNISNWAVGNTIIIADCERADIFAANGVTDDSITPPALSKAYARNAMIMQPRTLTFNPAGGTLVRDGQPLIDGVVNLVISYGVDENGDGRPNRYRDAASIGSWNRVVAARINLLLVGSQDPTIAIVDQPQQIMFNDAMWNAPDRRLYKAFNTTVALRNRLP